MQADVVSFSMREPELECQLLAMWLQTSALILVFQIPVFPYSLKKNGVIMYIK